jgi:hypothetical protein
MIFFERHANLAEETAHHRGVGFDPALGRQAIAESLKRDVRFARAALSKSILY